MVALSPLPTKISRLRHAMAEIATWLRQMKAAANRPIKYEAADGTMEFGRMIDRGIHRIRVKSGDPRI